MPNHTAVIRNTDTVFDYAIHYVVFDDGHGVITVSDTRTGVWNGHFTHNEDDNKAIVNRLLRLAHACESVGVRRDPTFLIQRAAVHEHFPHPRKPQR